MLALVLALLAAPPNENPARQPEPVLSGPAVVEQAPASPTIVARDFDGNVRRLEVSPEEAAASKLALSAAVRAEIDSVLVERAKILDRFVADNLDLLIKLNTAASAQDTADTLTLVGEGAWKLRELWRGGTLRSKIEAKLPEDQRGPFAAMVDGYWSAIVADRRASKKPNGKPPTKVEILIDERLKSLGKEVELAFRRQEKSGGLLYSYAVKDLGLDTHQEAVIKEALAKYSMEVKGEPTEEQNRDLFLRVLSVLTESQRTKLIEKFRK